MVKKATRKINPKEVRPEPVSLTFFLKVTAGSLQTNTISKAEGLIGGIHGHVIRECCLGASPES